MSGAQRLDIEVAVDGTQSASGLGQINTAVERTARTLDNLGDRGTAALDSIGTQSTVAAGRNDAATRSIISQVQRQIATMEAGERGTRSYYESMTRLRGANADALGPLLEQLDQVTARQAAARTGLSATANSLGQVGVSARQTAAAMRGVPAQITDIVTSLQGGQAPLTVFLQQGGQLRDMFGSAGGAARGLASGLTSLINPYTLAAAAAAALGLAYYQGSKEADAYNRALVMTGNVAGTSAGQLADMARGISASIGTQGDAAAALAALAGSGAVASKNLQQFGEVAVRAQKTIGLSVDETAKAFADLAKNPVAATQKLNDQYHYLTNAVYEQIKALEQQGRTQEAGEAAQQAFATALTQRTKGIEENLGYVERAWRSAGSVARQAWDSFMNVGRMQTFDQQLASVQEKLKLARSTASSGTGVASDWSEINRASARANVIALEAEEAKLRGLIKARKDAGDAAAATAKREGAANELSDLASKYLDKETQRQNALTAARQKAADASVGVEGKALEKIRADLKSAEAGINAQYAEKSKAKASAIRTEASAYVKLTTAIGERIDATAREAAGLGPMTESQRLQVALDEGVASGKIKLTAAQKTLYEQQIKTLAQNESVIESAKRAALGQAEVAKIYKSIAEEQARSVRQAEDEASRNEDLVRTFGMTKSAIAGVELARLEEQLAQRSSLGLTLDEIEHLEQLIDAKKRSAAAVSSLEELEKQRELWRGIESTAHDTFVSIFDSGKSAFDRLRDTLKNGLAELLYQMTIKKWIFNIEANVGSGSSGGLTGLAQAIGGAGGGDAAGSSAGGMLSTASTWLSAGKSIYSAFAGGISTSLGGYVSTLGNMFGSQAVSAFGTGMSLTASQAGTAAAAYGGTSTAVGGGLTAGAGFANAIPVIGWIISGMMASNSLYKQGWDFNNGSVNKLGQNLGSGINLVDQLARKLGFSNSTANIISGLAPVAKLFGRKNPEIESQGIEGSISTAGGFTGQAFANILEKGGWFRSDKRYSKTADLTTENDAAFDNTMAGMVAAVKGFGSVLGVQTSVIDGYNKAIKLTLTADEAKNKELIAGMFSGVADDLANLLVPSLAKFATEGEAAAATLQRVATNYAGVGSIMQSLGVDATKAFGAVGLASLEARERLIKLAGGVDALGSQNQFFVQNFLSAAEQLAPAQKAMAEQLTALGYTGITTGDQFKAAVLGLASSGALATEAGAKTYESLMQLAPAFKVVSDAAAAEAKARAELEGQIYDLTHTAAEATARQRQAELAAMDASLRPLQERIYALTDEKAASTLAAEAIKKAKDQAAESRATELKSYADFGNALADTIKKSREAAKALRDYSTTLLVGEGSPLSDKERMSLARAQFDGAKNADLKDASAAYLSALKEIGVTGLDYAKGFAAVQSRLLAAAAAEDRRADGAQDWLKWLASSRSMGSVDGSHASGLDSVPFDGYRAELHRNEKVLTSAEASDYRGGAKAIEENNALMRRLIEAVESGNSDGRTVARILQNSTPDGQRIRVVTT